jgi:opacity protein-like surface antigen
MIGTMITARTAALTVLTVALAFLTAAPARADGTIFLGANVTPSTRAAEGAALGVSFAVLGFEVEYCDTSDDAANLAPSLKTGMANALVQTPFPLFGLQPYATAGGGVYRETLGAHQDTSFGWNIGGGVKLTLIGPLKLRADYRMFNLGSGALYSPAHRIYIGLNVSF